jgi:hypothetical protein
MSVQLRSAGVVKEEKKIGDKKSVEFQVHTALAASLEYARIVGLVESGKWGGTDAGGTAGKVTGSGDGHRVSGSKPPTDDDAVELVGENCSILSSGLRSPVREMDGIESWSLNESIESRLFLDDVTTETLTPPLLLM